MLKEDAVQVVERLALKIISAVAPCELVVGLSGGADSTLVLILAHAVVKINPLYKVKAVHCIHGLDADDPIWLEHCTELCKRLQIPLVTPRLKIVYGNGRSPEEVSRAERYKALISNLSANSVLLLGHQADDRIESFFLALKRGSGPYGLSGMRFMIHDERGTIIRPLLELHKSKIIEIIEALGFTHVFDISNTYMKFERNFIRLKVLPLLRERFLGIDGSVLRSATLCGYEHDLAMRYAGEVLKKVFDEKELSLDISGLDLHDEPLMYALLRSYLSYKSGVPAEFSQVQEAYNLCRISNDQNVSISLHEGYELRRFLKKLYLVKPHAIEAKGQYRLSYGSTLSLGDYEYSLYKRNDDKGFAFSDVILDFAYKGSLKLHPQSRVHSREIKKLFVEYKIPLWERKSKCLVRDLKGNPLALGDVFICRAVASDEDNSFKGGVSELTVSSLECGSVNYDKAAAAVYKDSTDAPAISYELKITVK